MIDRLRQILAQRQKHYIVDACRLPAAVLVPIFFKQGDCYILFTRRTETVKEHKGQISFPGGAYEEEDKTLENTALRESNEEIGLATRDVDVLGELDDKISLTSNYTISPFVALIPWPYQFQLNQDETKEIIEVPIPALLDKNSSREESETLNGELATSYFYHYQGKTIWGATARILNQFLCVFTRSLTDE